MNEDTFADLPEDIQKALEEKVFGAPISRAIGAIWDGGDAVSYELTGETEGNTVTVASDADHAAFATLSEGIVSSVIGEIAAEGVDAQAAYDMIKSELSGN